MLGRSFRLIFNFGFSENFECVNPKGVRGRCILLQSCSFILNIARLYPQNQEAQNFVRQSQCGYDGRNIYVCCPSTTQLTPSTQSQSQSQQQSLAKILPPVQLPRPPGCGVDAENRIYGGTTTNVFEFPWLALLKYSKRKVCHWFCDGVGVNSLSCCRNCQTSFVIRSQQII